VGQSQKENVPGSGSRAFLKSEDVEIRFIQPVETMHYEIDSNRQLNGRFFDVLAKQTD
jgi:hypothetical protein